MRSIQASLQLTLSKPELCQDSFSSPALHAQGSGYQAKPTEAGDQCSKGWD